MPTQIKSDNKYHYFKYRDEVPAEVLKDQFDHLDPEESHDNFLKYKDYWYHISDFVRVEGDLEGEWDGQIADSAFSGVLIKVDPENSEKYKIATLLSLDTDMEENKIPTKQNIAGPRI